MKVNRQEIEERAIHDWWDVSFSSNRLQSSKMRHPQESTEDLIFLVIIDDEIYRIGKGIDNKSWNHGIVIFLDFSFLHFIHMSSYDDWSRMTKRELCWRRFHEKESSPLEAIRELG